jgi:hypothetical protein
MLNQIRKNEIGAKILSILAFIFIFFALAIIVITPPAKGYELSIYNAYAWYFWFFILLSIFFGVGIIIYEALTEKKSNWWLMGFIIIIISYIIFLAIPFFRGYEFYGKGDTLDHIGWMKDIINTGYIGSDDFYPIIHIIGVEINYIFNISLNITVSVIYIFFSLLYLMNVCLLARVICSSRGQTLLIVAFSSPLIYSYFHVNIHPAVLSLFMIPLFLFFYHKIEHHPNDKIKNTLLLLLLAFFITFFHPIVTIYTIIILLSFGVISFLFKLKQKSKAPFSNKIFKYKIYPTMALIMIVVLLFWYFLFSTFQNQFIVVLQWLFFQGHLPLVSNQISGLIQSNLQPIQIIELFINLYGAVFLYIGISTGVVILIIKKFISKNNKLNKLYFTYSILFIISSLFGLILFIGYFIEYEPIRVARFSVLMATILLGLVFYDLIMNKSIGNNQNRKTILKQFSIIFITLIIFVSIIISIFNVYGSPRTAGFNSQVTAMETTGFAYFLENQDQKTPIVLNFNPSYIKSYAAYIYGMDNINKLNINIDSKRLPSHFGYNNNLSIARTFDYKNKYFVISKNDELAYLAFPRNVQEKAYQWNKEDFTILESDPTVIRLYINDEFSIWRVFG